MRQAAEGTTVLIEFMQDGKPALAPYSGRWSNQPEPFRLVPVVATPGAPTQVAPMYDLGMAIQSRNRSAPGAREEVAVAILRQVHVRQVQRREAVAELKTTVTHERRVRRL